MKMDTMMAKMKAIRTNAQAKSLKPLPKLTINTKFEKSPKEKYFDKKQKSNGIGVGY